MNLLGSVQEQSVNKRDQVVETDTSDPAYRLATAQAAVSYGAGMSGRLSNKRFVVRSLLCQMKSWLLKRWHRIM